MTIAATGHRPDKLNNEYNGGPLTNKIMEQCRIVIETFKPDKIISGVALGIDYIWAAVGIALKIPVIAAIPFKGQESKWPKESQDKYHRLLRDCSEVVTVCLGGYENWKFQARNEWMVDQLTEPEDRLLAVWDGSDGGTKNCYDYAVSQSKQIILINPKSLI